MKKEIVDYTEGNTSWDKDEQAVIDLSDGWLGKRR